VRELDQAGRDPRYYLRLVWLRKWWLLAVIVLIPAAVYLVSRALPKTYESSTTLQVGQTAQSSEVVGGVASYSDSADVTATLIQTTAVARRAARQLGEPPSNAGALLGDIDAETISLTGSGSSEFLTITGEADDPERAAAVANAFARAVTNARTDEAIARINQTIAALTREAEGLSRLELTVPGGINEQLRQLRALKSSQGGATRVIEPAAPPGSPVSPQPRRNAAVGFVLALLIAAGLVPLFERLDRRLRDADDLEGLLGVPVLVNIPETAFPGNGASAEVREAFQTLRASLTAFNIDRDIDTVLVSSAMHGEGKTTVAANLAVALAQDERDVILVDGDLRRPQVMSRFGSRTEWGLDAVLLGEQSLDDALLELEVEGSGRLRLLPGGATAPNPAVLLGSQRMRSMLSELSARTDIVVLDTPPLLAVSDAIPLLDDVSGTVLVARVDYSSRDAVQRAAQVISAAGGSLLGAVATGTAAAGLYGYEDSAYTLSPGPRSKRWPRRSRRRRAKEAGPEEADLIVEPSPPAPAEDDAELEDAEELPKRRWFRRKRDLEAEARDLEAEERELRRRQQELRRQQEIESPKPDLVAEDQGAKTEGNGLPEAAERPEVRLSESD
jgi:capsular exopolysaccharide synthesis family protein